MEISTVCALNYYLDDQYCDVFFHVKLAYLTVVKDGIHYLSLLRGGLYERQKLHVNIRSRAILKNHIRNFCGKRKSLIRWHILFDHCFNNNLTLFFIITCPFKSRYCHHNLSSSHTSESYNIFNLGWIKKRFSIFSLLLKIR